MSSSLHLAQHVRCSAAEAYAFARDPANLPAWAAGLGAGVVEMAPPNAYGVLDHDVVLPDGTRVHVPMRVLPDGDDCEVVLVLRRMPGVTDDELEQDAAAVRRDLATLAALLER